MLHDLPAGGAPHPRMREQPVDTPSLSGAPSNVRSPGKGNYKFTRGHDMAVVLPTFTKKEIGRPDFNRPLQTNASHRALLRVNQQRRGTPAKTAAKNSNNLEKTLNGRGPDRRPPVPHHAMILKPFSKS